jgi:hypothetical protein
MYIYRDNKIRKIKDGTTLEQLKSTGYFDRHPNAIVCNKPPTRKALENYCNDGIARAIDGCKVEPDGHCSHNKPSWLLVLGYI